MKTYLACPGCTLVIVMIANFICLGIAKLFTRKTKKHSCKCDCHKYHD